MPFKAAVDALFARLGVDAVYTPQGGPVLTIKVIAMRPDQVIGGFQASLHTETTTFDVRVSEVAAAEAGDTIAFNGTIYVIQGAPRRADPDRLIWSLDTRPP
ncbi:MAG: hypothetical protein GWN37_19190 [Gammaproteobacteria bacterium]|nr:hypothetical protein [Gammaproteobacteria bacterium]